MSHTPEPVPVPSVGPQGHERRGSVRYPVAGRTDWQIHVLLGPDVCTAVVRDIAVGGIGFLLDRLLDMDTVVNLELTNVSRLFSCTRQARVAHVLPQLEGNFLTGCEFAAPLTYEQIYALLCR